MPATSKPLAARHARPIHSFAQSRRPSTPPPLLPHLLLLYPPPYQLHPSSEAHMTTAFSIGQHIGDYEIISILGAGGMGKVYKVRNVISERTEAMKILL